MKTFQKITLAAAISAAPFASQALEALDDSVLAATTGQAGVTIEINIQDTGISVGEIEYKDQGSVVINDVTLTGWDTDTGTADDVTITQTIDVVGNGSIQMTNSTAAGQQLKIGVGSIELQGDLTQAKADASAAAVAKYVVDNGGSPTDANAVAAGVAAANALTSVGSNSELVNNLDLRVELGSQSVTTIHNVDIATQDLGDFGVTGSYASDTAGLVIEADAAIAIRDMNVGMFGYTATQATQISNGAAADAGYTVANGDNVTDHAAGTDLASFDAVAAGGDNDGKIDKSEIEAYQTYVSGKSAVSLGGITFDNDGGLVEIEQTIWADGSGVYIQLGQIEGDLNISSINIGGASIGSVAVRDINLAGLTQKIYGHN
jgi:hypothetical protein